MRYSIASGIVDQNRAFFANNTIDVEKILALTSVRNTAPGNNILFIGRILPSKRIDILIDYFKEIKKTIKDCKLFIIGEGPELEKYKDLSCGMKDVVWLGGIVDEEEICKYAQISRIVFVPGHSGLSINHSFAYGKPYVTLELETQPPEIDYIIDGINGLILSSSDKNNHINKILRLFTDDSYYDKMSVAALETAKNLTLEKWVQSMINALKV
jgi:glycosyltransferase involved in cell wall biosynthesis